MTDDNDSKWSLVLAFPDDSASFALGFEAGRIWHRMTSGIEAEIEECLSSDNNELYQRMGVSLGWSVDAKSSEVEGWSYYTFVKVKAAPEKTNPHGLRVVS